jgi:hypothetical protein
MQFPTHTLQHFELYNDAAPAFWDNRRPHALGMDDYGPRAWRIYELNHTKAKIAVDTNLFRVE